MKHKKHVIIVGKGDGREKAPKRDVDASYEIWGINDLVVVDDVDLEFDMHLLEQRWHPEYYNLERGDVNDFLQPEINGKPKEEVDRLVGQFNIDYGLSQTVKRCNELGVKLYTTADYEFFDDKGNIVSDCIIDYPLDKVIKKFRALGRNKPYFTNGIDYMLAYAAYNDIKKVEMYGVNMALESEYAYEKPGVDFWVGLLIGRGVDVRLHDPKGVCAIMKSRDDRLYGYGYSQEDNRFMETTNYKFSVQERIKLGRLMTIDYKGTAARMKAIMALKNTLSFSEKEIKAFEIIVSEDGNDYKWDEKKAKDKVIPLTRTDLDVIRHTLDVWDKQKSLPIQCLDVYERFVDRNGDPSESDKS